MIKVSDVDKYSHSQFISSCLAWGCRQQHPRLITSEARGMMLGRRRGGAQDDAAARSRLVSNAGAASRYFACPPVVRQCKRKKRNKNNIARSSNMSCNSHYTRDNQIVEWMKNKDKFAIIRLLQTEQQYTAWGGHQQR